MTRLYQGIEYATYSRSTELKREKKLGVLGKDTSRKKFEVNACVDLFRCFVSNLSWFILLLSRVSSRIGLVGAPNLIRRNLLQFKMERIPLLNGFKLQRLLKCRCIIQCCISFLWKIISEFTFVHIIAQSRLQSAQQFHKDNRKMFIPQNTEAVCQSFSFRF